MMPGERRKPAARLDRLALGRIAHALPALLAGCLQLSDPAPSQGNEPQTVVDEPATPKTILLVCASNRIPFYILPWELTVDPAPIESGELFSVGLAASVVLPEALLDFTFDALVEKRVNIVAGQATVLVRSGVGGEAKTVTLVYEHPVDWTCTYDDEGNTGPYAGPFPTCDPSNDIPGGNGANEDCVGLRNIPDPDNPCGQFRELPFSEDCEAGGNCEQRGERGPGSQCDQHGFCLIGPMRVPLRVASTEYRADDTGKVLFGWDDQNTAAEESCNQASICVWEQPVPEFNEPIGPNGFRAYLAGEEVAFECTMGTDQGRRMPDTGLIAFEIQPPANVE